ncbi:MAG TPA: hypothetical protein VLG69_02415 [Candidatus Andersenbacteria bacterium]|nr:hypothetical protein [Candidatus Andersenbacteria bacterium]
MIAVARRIRHWSWRPKLKWPKHPIIVSILVILGLIFLPEVKELAIQLGKAIASGVDSAVNGTPRSEWGILPEQSSSLPQKTKPRRATENEAWYLHFAQMPLPYGWDVLPTKVSVIVPLDGRERYSGLNATFMGGSNLNIDCTGHTTRDGFDLFARTDGKKERCLGQHNDFSIGRSSRAAGEWFVRALKNERWCQAEHFKMTLQADPLPNHIRIAMTKQCIVNEVYDVMLVQIGTKEESPPWQLYIRFADENGDTLEDAETQKHGGHLALGTVQGEEFHIVYEDKMMLPRSAYSSSVVPSTARSPMLKLRIPNVEGRRTVKVEIVLDIDYSNW